MRALGRLPRARAHPGADEGTIARLDAAADGRELASVLASLPAADRDALLLVAWAELTYEEAAQAAAVPVGTIRSRVHRARSALRKAMQLPPIEENHHG